jgi:hypothetical protein
MLYINKFFSKNFVFHFHFHNGAESLSFTAFSIGTTNSWSFSFSRSAATCLEVLVVILSFLLSSVATWAKPVTASLAGVATTGATGVAGVSETWAKFLVAGP